MRTLWKNGTFYSMKRPGHFYRSLITENGYITECDGNPSQKVDRVVDCLGAFVFPGFVDAHLHLLGYGERLTLPNVKHCQGKKEVLTYIREVFQGKPLLVQGYEEIGITSSDLDTISTTMPIVLRHSDYHGATVNRAKLNELGITSKDGILKEEAANQAVYSFPKHSIETLSVMIQNAYKTLHAFGLTGGHSDDLFYFNGFFDTIQAFEIALKTSRFRTHLLMHHQTIDDFILSRRPWLNQTQDLQLGAVKMFYDGTLTSKTALMSIPFRDGSFGQRIDAPLTWENRLQKMRNLGLPVAIHVIGDQGLDEVANSLLKFPVKSGLHDRIIHASFAQPKTIATLKKMSVILDIQPQFLTSDFPKGFALFSQPPQLIYPWKTYRSAGLTLCGSSDAPVETPNPLLGIFQAVYRQADPTSVVIGETERLSMFEAISLYTSLANVPTYETNRGVLQEGNVADFTMLNRNPFTISKEAWNELHVTQTVIDDHQVYRK